MIKYEINYERKLMFLLIWIINIWFVIIINIKIKFIIMKTFYNKLYSKNI